MKAERKILLYFFITLVVLLIAFAGSVILFKDRIIQQFISEANKSLNTPVQIGRFDISSWQDFPNLTITCTDVYVEDSHPGIYPLLKAKSVSFSINTLDAWRGKYSVRGLQINQCETHLKIDEEGHSNFVITKKAENPGKQLEFDLRQIKLNDTKVEYYDKQSRQHHIFQSDKLVASIKFSHEIYTIETQGDVTIGQIGIKNLILLKDKKFDLTSIVRYDDKEKQVKVEQSNINLGQSEFELKGEHVFKDKDNINVELRGKNTNVQTLLSLLPEFFSQKLKAYQSKGEVYFSLALQGDIAHPLMKASFGCKNTSFVHTGTQSKIDQANFSGSFFTPSLTDFSNAEIRIQNLSGYLNGKQIQSNFSIQNFDDPVVTLDFKGASDASVIQNFYAIEDMNELKGTVEADVSFAGRISLLKNKATAQQVQTTGTIDLHDLSFISKNKIQFSDINGSLHFNKNDIAMSNLKGKLERSDFLLNGFLKNVITYLLFDHQPIGVEADLKSDFLDLDRLVAIGLGSGSTDFGFSISPLLHLNFNCDVKRMKYKRFDTRLVKGDLLIRNQIAVSRHLSLQAMGGSLEMNGIVDAKNPKAIDVSTAFRLNSIHIDSVFYVFENFHQNFIEAAHLKGQAHADVNLEMNLNQKLKLYPETLVADIDVLIKNGELNDFEPLQKLNKYLDDQALNRLRFADLKNNIHIEKRMIFIPQMEIRSNATTISLSGIHSFDQLIDYRVVAPLRNKKKIDPDEAFGAVEETGGQTKIFLKIVGTTDQYDVKLDKEATKKKIVSDLKKEVKELKEAFQTRGAKKKKEVELKKDEYFDWDN
ncbi:MAG: hypothetical protein JST43_10860 [Bacteroidetes bacterium]|nr:hypothetical protein [Bacteroidota bacterium]MBS1540117.1 hypothetical protein [Bacteroidota bacterium]